MPGRCFIWDNEKKCVKRVVKNLGWLLSHWKDIESFVVREPKITGNCEAYFEAKLKNNFSFVCYFQSQDVLANFLKRPVFYGLNLEWFGENIVIAKETK
jgi:hypothetical protein